MNMKFLLTLTMLAPGAFAHEACVSKLNLRDVPSAMGEKVTAMPVFSNSVVKGWRLYGTRTSEQLTRQGVNPGALMTHICGVPANEIDAKGGDVCCGVDTSREFVVTIQFPDHETKVLIRRPAG